VVEHMGQHMVAERMGWHMVLVEGIQDEHTPPQLGAQLARGALEHELELAPGLVGRLGMVSAHRLGMEPAEGLAEGQVGQPFEQLEPELEHQLADPHGMVGTLHMAH